MTSPVFVYGTLQYPTILNILLHRVPTTTPAVVHGYRRCRVLGRPYPAVIMDPDGSVEGMLLSGLHEDELDVLHDYEGEEYVLHTGVEAVTDSKGGTTTNCALYLWGHAYMDRLVHPLEPWDQAAFEKNELDAFVASLRNEYVESSGEWGAQGRAAAAAAAVDQAQL